MTTVDEYLSAETKCRDMTRAAHMRTARDMGKSFKGLMRMYQAWEDKGWMVVDRRNVDGSPRNFTVTGVKANGEPPHDQRRDS